MQQDAKLKQALEGSIFCGGMLPAAHDDRLAGLTQPPEPLR
jgi:hypothetical protein